MRTLRSLSLVTAALAAGVLPASATNITINYQDSPGEGFNDTTVVGSTTRGALRRASLEYAVAIWSARLGGNAPAVINATCDPLGGSATSAVLGFAGASTSFRDFAGAPQSGVFYQAALANQLFGSDLNGATAEISTTYNSDVDNSTVLGTSSWYYGLDQTVPGGDVSFVRVALHELGHGLGFAGNVSSSTGAYNSGFPNSYDTFIQQGTGGSAVILRTMTNGTRLASLTGGNLFFNGPDVQAGNAGAVVRIYAPNPFQGGSSYSHFDPSVIIGGFRELMEPAVSSSALRLTSTDNAFRDIGWPIIGPSAMPSIFYPASSGSTPKNAASFDVTVSLTATSTEPVTYVVLPNPGGTDTATPGVHYTLPQTSITIPANTLSGTFTVLPISNGTPTTQQARFRLTRVVNAEFSNSTSFTLNLTAPVAPLSNTGGAWDRYQ